MLQRNRSYSFLGCPWMHKTDLYDLTQSFWSGSAPNQDLHSFNKIWFRFRFHSESKIQVKTKSKLLRNPDFFLYLNKSAGSTYEVVGRYSLLSFGWREHTLSVFAKVSNPELHWSTLIQGLSGITLNQYRVPIRYGIPVYGLPLVRVPELFSYPYWYLLIFQNDILFME